MQKLLLTSISLVLISFGLSACLPSKPEPTVVGKLNQDSICSVKDLQSNNLEIALKDCTPGQKFVWLSGPQDTDQSPVVVAASLCDFRYAVVYASSGVTCIYLKADDVAKKSAVAPVPSK